MFSVFTLAQMGKLFLDLSLNIINTQFKTVTILSEITRGIHYKQCVHLAIQSNGQLITPSIYLSIHPFLVHQFQSFIQAINQSRHNLNRII